MNHSRRVAEHHRQYVTAGVDAVVYGYPTEIAQTRQFFAELAHDAPVTGAGPRVAMWDASIKYYDGLSERFLGRWGYPMDLSAWAAYAAVEVTVNPVVDGSQRLLRVRLDPTGASLGELAEVVGVVDVGGAPRPWVP